MKMKRANCSTRATCTRDRQPCAIRAAVEIEPNMTPLPLGRAQVRRQGKGGIAILCFGVVLQAVQGVADELDATLVDMRFVKPLDEELIANLAQNNQRLITIEENAVLGGAGSAVNEYLARIGSPLTVLNLGLPDRFLDHGTRAELLEEAQLDSASLHDRILEFVGTK